MNEKENRRFLHRYDGKKVFWLRGFKQLILIFVIVFILFRGVIGISVVKGDSMFPTYTSGQLVGFTRIVRHFERGDVISVRMPSGDYYLKRVIAVGGDTVDLRDGEVYVNNEKLDEPYAQGETKEQDGVVEYPYTLPEDTVFVMGDNREVSVDSRTFGYVMKKQIKGKIW